MVRQLGYSLIVGLPVGVVMVLGLNLLKPADAIVWVVFLVYVAACTLIGSLLEERAVARDRLPHNGRPRSSG